MTFKKISNPLWKWEASLDAAQNENLIQAVERNRRFARLTAWSYLHDEDLCVDLMEAALEPVVRFAIVTVPTPSMEKLSARLRSQLRRVAKQCRNRHRAIYAKTPHKLEIIATTQQTDPAEGILLQEVLKRLTPRARLIASQIRLGHSWREIGAAMHKDHSMLRKAFRREMDAALLRCQG